MTQKIGQRSNIAFQGLFVLAAILCSATILFVLSRTNPTDEIPSVVIVLLITNAIILATMLVAVGSDYIRVRNRNSQKGARLTRRFMLLFAASAIIPAFVVSLFLWASISRGIDTWFGDRVFTIVEQTAAVARESLIEFEETFENDTLNVATDVNNAADGLSTDKARFEEYLGIQGYVRNMTGAFVVSADGSILASGTNLGPSSAFPNPGLRALVDAGEGDIVVTTYQRQGVVTSLKQLSDIEGGFLYLVKPFDPLILQRLETAQENLTAYRLAKDRSSQTKVFFVLAYLQIVILVLILSVRLAQSAAMRISEPITELALAAQRVTSGQEGVRVATAFTGDEVEDLSNSFNVMTETLDERRQALVGAREESDERRVFVETLLSEMNAGVIRLDSYGKITLANKSAETLLGKPLRIADRLSDVAPELSSTIPSPNSNIDAADISISLKVDDQTRHIRVRTGSDGAAGLIVTLDDTTRLISAQRQLAWRDVARRVAHEIRNPLTPIQLSAERLKRRYAGKIDDEKGVFERCVTTILRQVEDIGRMVGEFSDFARMPKPVPELCNLRSIIENVIFEQQVVNPDIRIQIHAEKSSYKLLGDARLLSQAFGNLVKNSAEALNSRSPEIETPPRIAITITQVSETTYAIVFEDNGPGFPEDLADKLLEPYVTNKEGGTGLGLAIVNRVIMDHGGTLELMEADKKGQGARVQVSLPAWHDENGLEIAQQPETQKETVS
ncbi:MAG: ATP-binding protein [Pseudomonadota bacterium]